MARVDDFEPNLWRPSSDETNTVAPANKADASGSEEAQATGKANTASDGSYWGLLARAREIWEVTTGTNHPLFRQDLAQKEDNLPSEKDLQEAEHQRNLGEAHLLDGDYARSAEAYEKAIGLDSSYADDPLVMVDLGKARFGLKDYRGAREAYGVALALAPRHDETRRLDLEANQKHLATLDSKKDAKEIAAVEKDIIADQAMLVALGADKERKGIKELGTDLSKLSPKSPDEAKKILEQVHRLAQNYLAYGSAEFSDPKDAAFVRGELNALAGEAFQVLCSLSSNSVYEEVRGLTPLYEGYFFLTEGNVDLASEKFEKVRGKIPEADAILKRLAEDRTRASKQMEVNRLRSVNLAVLDAWEAYIEEGTAVEVDQVNGLLGKGLQLVGGQNEAKVRSRWARDEVMVVSIRRKIKSGNCEMVHAALEEMAKGDDAEAKRARALLANEYDGSRNGSYILEHLIAYASNLESKKDLENQLLDDADQTNARYGAAQTPSWVYAILQETASNDEHKKRAGERIEELKNGKGFRQQIWDMIRTIGTDDLVQIALMAGASKVGALTKLAALNRLKKAGITGYKAVLLAGGAEVLAEGTTLWALNTLHESATHDVNKVFSADHLLKSYGATLVMLPFIKLSSAGGKNAGTSLARRLGMIAEGGSPLSRWGKVFASGVTHTFGAGGMVAASQTNQALKFVPVAPGGFKGTLVHEVFGYAKYAFAGGAFHKALGAKHAEAHERLQNDIAIKEAAVLTEGHLKALGHRPSSRTKDGAPVFEDPEAQDLYGQMIFLSLSQPGFSGGKVSRLLAQGKETEAESYLRSFGLKPTFGGEQRLVGFEEISYHEEVGIEDVPAKPMIPADAAFASGAVPLFAILVENGVPTGVAAVIAGATLILPAMVRMRGQGPASEPSRTPQGQAYAPGTIPTPKAVPQPLNAAADLARMNEFTNNLRRVDTSEIQGHPDFANVARRVHELQAKVDRANGLQRELRNAGPVARPYIIEELNLRLAEAESLAKGISADHHRMVVEVRGPQTLPPNTIDMKATPFEKSGERPAVEEPSAVTRDVPTKAKPESQDQYITGHPLEHPSNKNADPVEKLLYLQAEAAHVAKEQGRASWMGLKIEHDAGLQPTHVTVRISPEANPHFIGTLKGILDLNPTTALEPGMYEVGNFVVEVQVAPPPDSSVVPTRRAARAEEPRTVEDPTRITAVDPEATMETTLRSADLPRGFPLGFESKAQFVEFSRMVRERLRAAGIPDEAKIVIQGSSVRGVDQNGEPFRWDGANPSDIDIAVIMPREMLNGFVQKRAALTKKGQDNSLPKLFKMLWNQGRMTSYHFDPELRRAHNDIRDAFPSRKIQISLMVPDSVFAPESRESLPLAQ